MYVEIVLSDVCLNRVRDMVSKRFIFTNASPDVAGRNLNHRDVDNIYLTAKFRNAMHYVIRVDHDTGTQGDADADYLGQFAWFVPVWEIPVRVLAHQESNGCIGETALMLSHAVRSIGESFPLDVDHRDSEVRIIVDRHFEHRQSVMVSRNVLISLVWRSSGRQKQDTIEIQPESQFVGDNEVTMMDWVERSAEYPDVFSLTHTLLQIPDLTGNEPDQQFGVG